MFHLFLPAACVCVCLRSINSTLQRRCHLALHGGIRSWRGCKCKLRFSTYFLLQNFRRLPKKGGKREVRGRDYTSDPKQNERDFLGCKGPQGESYRTGKGVNSLVNQNNRVVSNCARDCQRELTCQHSDGCSSGLTCGCCDVVVCPYVRSATANTQTTREACSLTCR